MIRFLTLLCAVWAVPSAAVAQDPGAPLVELLSYLDVPLRPATLTRAGATPSALAAIAQDPARLPYVRMRAAASLAFFDSPVSQRALTELALDPATDREVRISAVSGLSHLATPGVEAPLATVLTSGAELPVREAALRAIARLGTARGRPLLRDALDRLAPADPMRAPVDRALAQAARE